MAHLIDQTPVEYHVDCGHCHNLIAYNDADIKEYNHLALRKRWIVCPACSKQILLSYYRES